jgi:uncharacterized protein YfaS (alpha-2-macroglobulin family)
MKKIVFLSVFTFFSSLIYAQNEFDSFWQKVAEFEKKGLPKSALSEVEKIYNLAKTKSNSAQLVKTILFKSKYALTLKENAQLKIVKELKNEIAKAKVPEKNILESILADLYWQYFKQNRWKFYNRTHTDKKIDSVDFRTWDLHTIFKEITKHHQNALQNSLELQQIPIKVFDPILVKHKESEKYRPTIYDFIAHRALEFYKTGESNLPQPAVKFEIKDPNYLGDISSFLKAKFESKDKESQKLQALILYKNLTLFHKNDKDKTALIALTLDRLDFVKENARFNNANETYLQTLLKLQKQFRKLPISTEIDYRIAKYYSDLARQYSPQNPVNQYKFRNALEVCEIAISNFPDSLGALNCKNLKEQILAKKYNLTSELFIEENKKSFVKVEYKNVANLHFRVYQITENQEKTLQTIYNNSEVLKYIKQFKFVNEFSQKLKSLSDFQSHSTEVVFPKLNHGRYLILVSTDNRFNDYNSFSFNFITVTNVAYIQTVIKGKHKFQLVDRKTGKPLPNVNVHFENFETSRYNKKINLDLTTDSNGFVEITPNNYHNRVILTVFYNNTKTEFKYFNFNKSYHYGDLKLKNKRIFLFSDRSIYRPGQTVYYKGIAVFQEENKSRVLSNQSITVVLRDANYQTVKEINTVTNEFGSFSGEFILPNTGLTGNFVIRAIGKRDIEGVLNFSVEEYKRPKFYAKFLPVNETFKINDTVTVKGQAIAFAGSKITNAKVVYRVTRMVQYPKWFYWYRPVGFSSEAQEITNGQTETNDKGEFTIDFLAKPDLSVKKEQNPIFSYQITADVTDINGETRSTNTIVKVGYHSKIISATVDDKLDKNNKENNIVINTTNLNGQFIPLNVAIKVYKVKHPNNVKRKRPWSAPDLPIINSDEWEKLFSHDYYKDFIPFESLGKLVFQTTVNTKNVKEVKLPKTKKWISGDYVVIAKAIDDSDNVFDKQLFSLYSNKDKKVADNKLFVIKTDKNEYKPNENVIVKIGSASNDISVLLQVEKNKKIVQTKIVHLSNEIKTVEFPVTKKDLGGFVIHYNYVNFNSNENGKLYITVPHPKTQLDIETITFRDKLLPNQEQTWSFKIKGTDKDKVVAEILASMYDASLDEFKKHQWQFNPIYHKIYYPILQKRTNSFGEKVFRTFLKTSFFESISNRQYDKLNWFGFNFGDNYFDGFGYKPMINDSSESLEEVVVTAYQGRPRKRKKLQAAVNALAGSVAGVSIGSDTDIENHENEKPKLDNNTDFSAVKIRSNFNETAFFYPHLQTDEKGNVSFTFTTPESLTKWKIQLLAHNKELHSGLKTLEAVTQKDLMVLPNAPRFLRQGDTLVFQTKIANISDKNLTGSAQLQLFDALTNKEISDKLIIDSSKTVNFSVKSKENTVVSYKICVPDNVQSILYKIIAKAGDFSDGEQNVLPVLTNRMLVTETMPMWIRSNQTKTFELKKLKNTSSKTRKNHLLTLEITSNPAWYAVQALPYLMEYPYECSEQTFSRLYANTLASHIANSNPKIQQVFNQWKNSDALLSNLEKNQELKSLIIQETPWLRDAMSETEQKKRIALLFDLNKMSREQQKALRKLQQMQMSSGGFPWFKGGRYENRYITQHIVSGIGHLNKLGVSFNDKSIKRMTDRALYYLDNKILDDYNSLLKQADKIFANSKNKDRKIEEYLNKNHTSNFQVHYLYTRSFYKEISIPNNVKKAVNYYTSQAEKYWLDYNLYSKGLITLVANRNENYSLANKILQSLKETSITNEELGMYWKENRPSYFWHQAPIETQALMIEVFTELKADIKDVDNLKIWLLKNKQTNRWNTTKATTEAVYALLLQGTNWIETTDFVKVKIGSQEIDPLKLKDTKVEAGTGYYKKSWKAYEITPEMAKVTIKKEGQGIAWGALYWQYFEDLDKITFAKTPLEISKKLFLKTNGERGEVITEITKNTNLRVGDLIRVRIKIKVDRAMEFVHLKDMRASGFEPVNVLSKYKWQDGLGYYESTKDASTNFFISYLPKGVYVFEYDLRANNAGYFSNGITTIQSMYAPEFTSHSDGIRVKIKNQ